MSTQSVAHVVLCLIQVSLMMVGVQTMPIDEIIANAAETPSMLSMSPPPASQGQAAGQSNDVRVELDMVYTTEQWQAIQTAREQSGLQDPRARRRPRRKAIRNTIYRWPGGRIPYEIDSTFSREDRDEIQKAIEEWERFTCIKFVPATSSDTNKIQLKSGGGCYSNVGMKRGPQTVGLALGCRYKSVVIHELGHAVGFQHEQTRPDRDDYVVILSQNIRPHLLYNFQKFPRSQMDTMGVPYDYLSIMHYGEKYFSFNGKETIWTIDRQFQKIIGEGSSLSFLDMKLTNLLYRCSAHCDPSIRCPAGGFLDKSCTCMCSGEPVQKCSSSGRQTGSGTTGSGRQTGIGTTTSGGRTGSGTTTSDGGDGAGPCIDQYQKCKEWKRLGKCWDQDRVYMEAYCRQSCGFCDLGPVCKDQSEHCQFWKGEGHCTNSFANYMQLNCNRSCGFCSASSVNNHGDSIYNTIMSGDDKAQNDDTANGVTSQPMTSWSVVASAVGVLLIRV